AAATGTSLTRSRGLHGWNWARSLARLRRASRAGLKRGRFRRILLEHVSERVAGRSSPHCRTGAPKLLSLRLYPLTFVALGGMRHWRIGGRRGARTPAGGSRCVTGRPLQRWRLTCRAITII